MASVLLWFQYGGVKLDVRRSNRRFIQLEEIKELYSLPVPAESIVLKAKKSSESQYTVLDSEYLSSNNCGSLVKNFDLSWNNPIQVTTKEETSGAVTVETVSTSTGTSMTETSTMTGTSTTETSKMTGTSTTETSTMSTQSQVRSNEIWVAHKDQDPFSFDSTVLGGLGVSYVEGLITLINFKLSIEKKSEKAIILRKGSKDLILKTPISELYNTKNDPLEVITDELADKMSKLAIQDNEPDYEFASLAFDHEFKDNSNYFKNFQDYITLCHKSSKDTYMPYISIVQSSGYGKSRLIGEYAKHVHTLYLNLGIGRKCFPRPSTYAMSFIESFEHAKDPIVWFNIFLAKAVFLVNETKLSPGKFWEYHLNDNGESIWKPAIEAANMHENSKQKELEKIKNNAGYLTEKFNVESEIKVLLCVDEGRTLIQNVSKNLYVSLFRCWRRALRDNRWRARGLFSVILDTTSRLSNFAPAPGNDPTIKALADDYNIFMPFVYVSTFNFLAESSSNYYDQAFSGGRPCWKALKDAYCKGSNSSEINEIYAWEKVKALVKIKLQGGSIKFTDIDEESKTLTSVAVLASLCSVDISPSVHIASSLIASHLGTCLAVSQDRTKVLVCYPSEPLVTEAAYEFLDDAMLLRISQAFGQGVVESGKRGEIIGELILVLTRQKLQKRRKTKGEISFFAGEIKLKDFLIELLGENNIVKDNDTQHDYFKNGNISFTRFVTICTIPTSDDVKMGYETGVAFNLKRNQKGADLLIPIRINNSFTFWIIQIKNHNLQRANSDFQVDSTSKLMPSYIFEKSDLGDRKDPYLAMYWQLGAHVTETQKMGWGIAGSVKFSEQNPEPTTHYAILGLNSFKIARGKTREGLRAILNAYVDPYDEIWSNNDQFLGNQAEHIETFLKPWHIPRSKLNSNLLLDEYNDEDSPEMNKKGKSKA